MDQCDARDTINLFVGEGGGDGRNKFIEGVAPVVSYIPPVVSYFTVV